MRLAVNRLDMKSDNKNLCYIIKSANHQPHHRLRTRTKTRFQRVQRRAHAGVHIRVCFVYYYDKVAGLQITIGQCPTKFGKCLSKSNFDRTLVRSQKKLSHTFFCRDKIRLQIHSICILQ
jgi:hypothetical protein